MYNNKMVNLKINLEKELKDNILKFWMEHSVDEENGGFYGYISDDLIIDKNHPKASVLNSRILWTFSTAYRLYKDEKYLLIATRAFNYIIKHFLDKEQSGVYWMLDYSGNVLDSKKQVYSIAFAIYGLSEYYRATQNTESLKTAIELYKSIEKYAYDDENNGYIEAFSREWLPIPEMSLSSCDINSEKSMNTHLHILEAYTNLLRVWDNSEIRSRLKELIYLTISNIIDSKTNQFKLFFDRKWNSQLNAVSFGHDIEGSWLLYEAAQVLGDESTLCIAKDISIKMAKKVYEKGFDPTYGGLYYEEENGVITNDNKDWWPQAESVVGFFNLYELTKNELYLDKSIEMWHYIDKNIIDKVHGEWFWGKSADGQKVTRNEKVGPWKCPYHNSRMCFEVIERIEKVD